MVVVLTLTLTIAWMSQGRVPPFFLFWNPATFLASHLPKCAWSCCSPLAFCRTLLAASPEVCAGSILTWLPSAFPQPSLTPVPDERAVHRAETMKWIMVSKATYRHSGLLKWSPYKQILYFVFPVLKHRSSQLKQFPFIWANYFPGVKRINSAERLSLEVCKLEKAWSKFIRSQDHCDMKEKPLEFCWLGLVWGL